MTSRFVALENIADISAGNPAPQDAADFSEDGQPFVRMQDVGREHHTRTLTHTADKLTADAIRRNRLRLYPAGTLLIPKSGASINLNHRALLARDAYVVSHLATVVPYTSLVDAEYLYFWSLTYDPRSQAQTTSLPSLPTSLIKSAQVPLPSLPEQRQIVDLLSRAEGIVRLRREAQCKAAELVPALFLDMFGDPASNPKGWPLVELGELIVDGPQNGLYKHKSLYGDGTPILRIDGFYDGVVNDLASLQRVRLTSAEIERYGLTSGEIVINRVNSPDYLGKSALIPDLHEPTVFESNMMRLRLDTTRITQRFAIVSLQTDAVRKQILASAKHAINQSSINQQDVKALRFSLPPIELQRQFAAKAEAVRGIASQQATALATAQATFDALLHRSFAVS